MQHRDPVFDAKAHTIVPLVSVLNGEDAAINQIKQEFKKRGWCIVRTSQLSRRKQRNFYFGPAMKYDHFPVPSSDTDALSAFFSLPDATKESSYGYSAVPHKESVHVTSPIWNEMDRLETGIKELVGEWVQVLDEISIDMLEAFAKPLFGCDNPTLAYRADLPIGYGGHRGMLDIAYYRNQQTVDVSPPVGFSTQDVNCVPHYDPGLLSFSFLSTTDGLQLQDPTTGEWFAGPVNTRVGEEDIGVVWLGAAAAKASKGELREGVHRVVYPNLPTPRITAWYEICTVDQVNQEIQNNLPTEGTIELPNLPGSKPLTLRMGEKRQIERHYGLPMSKVPRRSDYFAAGRSADVKVNNKNKNGWSEDVQVNKKNKNESEGNA